jgi:hypothetical protein
MNAMPGSKNIAAAMVVKNILQKYYRADLLKEIDGRISRESGASIYKAFYYPQIKPAQDNTVNALTFENDYPLSLCFQEQDLPNSVIYDYYFSLHNETYVSHLDMLLSGVSIKKKCLTPRKCIVAIPAMNEPGLNAVWDAFLKSCGPSDKFINEVVFLIYHNYKEAALLDEKTKKTIDVVKNKPNVVLIEEQAPSFHTTGMAKKTVSDLAMRLEGKDMAIAIIMCDADIRRLTDNIVNHAVDALSQYPHLAAAPDFDYTGPERDRYPVLDLIWKIRKDIDLIGTRILGSRAHRTHGMFYAIKPRILALVGGIKPTETYEDMQLSRELRAQAGLLRKWPKYDDARIIAELNTIHGATAWIAPDREIAALRSGKRQWSRWLSEDEHLRISGTARQQNDMEGSANQPEFSSLTPENLVAAINRSQPFLVPELSALDTFIPVRVYFACIRSKALVRSMNKHCIKLSAALVRRIAGGVNQSYDAENIIVDTQSLNTLMKDNEESWYIEKVLDVEIAGSGNS